MQIFLMMMTFAFANSSQPLIMAENASLAEYEEVTQQPGWQTWLEYQETHLEKASLKDLLIRGQFHFLQGSLDKANRIFTQIVEQRLQQSWSKSQRQNIAYAYFRLAQLEESETKKIAWLQQLLEFDRHLDPDEQLFPPPLVKLWQKLKSQTGTQQFLLPRNAQQFDQVKINGRSVNPASGIVEDSPGVKRVEFLSNRYKAVVAKIAIEDLESFDINPLPMASGSCDSPINDSTELGAKIFYSSRCILDGHQQVAGLQKELVKNQLQPVENARGSFWQRNRTTIWISAALLSAVAAWQISENQKTGSPPQTEYVPQTRSMTNGY